MLTTAEINGNVIVIASDDPAGWKVSSYCISRLKHENDIIVNQDMDTMALPFNMKLSVFLILWNPIGCKLSPELGDVNFNTWGWRIIPSSPTGKTMIL
jgi:hypothetical protein